MPTPTTPGSETLPPSPPRPPRARWPWIALAVTFLAAAGYWLGDVPNRYQASQLSKSAQVALLSSNFQGALSDYRQALLLRPMDFELLRQYNDVQSRWLQTFERHLSGKAPEAAYQALQAAPDGIEGLLTEPQLGEYRQQVETVTTAFRQKLEKQMDDAMALSRDGKFEEAYAALKPIEAYYRLVPDLPAKRREIEVAQVKAVIEEAQAAADQKNYTGARQTLEAVAKLGKGVPDFEQRLAEIRQSERVATVAAAEEAVKLKDFDAAWAAYEEVVKLGLPKDEAEQLHQKIGQAAFELHAGELVRAIVKHSEADVRASLGLLARDAKLPTADIDPKQLVGESIDFDQFTAILKQLQFETPPDSPDFRPDVNLIYVLLPRFKDPVRARAFLVDAVRQWSRSNAAAGRAAVAVALYRRSLEFGAAADPAFEPAQLDALRRKWNFTVVLDELQSDDADYITARPLAEAALDALRADLGQGEPAWPTLILAEKGRPAPNAKNQIELVASVSDFRIDRPQSVSHSLRYQAGTHLVTNQERRDKLSEHKDLVDRFNRLQREVADLDRESNDAQNNPNLTPDQRTSAVLSAAASALAKKFEINKLNSEIDDLERELRSMPQQIEEPVYATEDYHDITHHYTFTATLSVQARWDGFPISEMREVKVSVARTTHEVDGNRDHGAPTVAETKVDAKKLTADLTGALVQKIKAGGWFDLPSATWQYVLARNASDKVEGLEVADNALGLALLWEARGIKIDGLKLALHAVNEALLTTPESMPAK